jgi:hypothetical protein
LTNSRVMAVAAILAGLLFSIHVTDDIVRGFDGAGPENLIGFFVVSCWLYTAIAFGERKPGLILCLAFAVLSSAIPLLHMRGPGGMLSPRVAETEGTFLWVWTLLALAVASNISALAAARGLWLLRRDGSA